LESRDEKANSFGNPVGTLAQLWQVGGLYDEESSVDVERELWMEFWSLSDEVSTRGEEKDNGDMESV
jgi:hypothetical protein